MKRSRNAAGFTLLELLVTIFVMAVVMTAIAAAMNGSLENYAHNENVALTTQAGRSVLNGILSEVRTCLDATVTDGGVGLEIIPPDDVNARIHYRLSGEQLLYKPAGSETYHALLGSENDQVTVRTFRVHRRYDLADPADPNSQVYNASVTVALEVEANGQVSSMEASALIRKNLAY